MDHVKKDKKKEGKNRYMYFIQYRSIFVAMETFGIFLVFSRRRENIHYQLLYNHRLYLRITCKKKRNYYIIKMLESLPLLQREEAGSSTSII